MSPLIPIEPASLPFALLCFGRWGTGKTEYIRRRLGYIEERFGRVVVADPRGQWGAVAGVDRLADWFIAGGSGVAFVRAFTEPERRAIGRLVWSFGNCVMILDEFQLYGTSGGFVDPVYKLLWTEGRSYGVKVIAITQRPTMIPTVARFNVTDVVAFKAPVNGLGWLSEACPGLELERIPSLDAAKYEHVSWGPNVAAWG